MTDLRINGIKATGSAIVLAAAMSMTASGAASAAEWFTTFLSTNKVEYLDNFVNDEQNAAIREDEVRLLTNNQVYATGVLENNRIARVGGRLQYFQHIDRTDQDSLGVGAFADIGQRFSNGVFVRGGIDGTYRRKDGANQFVEAGGTFLTQYAPSRSYRAQLTLRGDYRDFDDNNFAGLDQVRLHATGRLFWYPFEDSSFILGEVGVLDTNADQNFQSNVQTFVAIRGHYAFTDRTSVTLRARYTMKTFDAGNPAVQGGITREDDIFQVFGQVDHKFNKSITGFAEAGVVEQDSNINNQSFTGPRFGVGVKLLFSTR